MSRLLTILRQTLIWSLKVTLSLKRMRITLKMSSVPIQEAGIPDTHGDLFVSEHDAQILRDEYKQGDN